MTSFEENNLLQEFKLPMETVEQVEELEKLLSMNEEFKKQLVMFDLIHNIKSISVLLTLIIIFSVISQENF